MNSFYIKFFYLFFILLFNSLIAQTIDIAKENEITLLKYSDVYFDKKRLPLAKIIKEKLFRPYNKEYINSGMKKVNIWVRFQLKNSSDKSVEKIVVITSPIIENIALYQDKNLSNPQYRGVINITMLLLSFDPSILQITGHLKCFFNWKISG